ncbi:cupin domain-containing protein [uncultured Jannaschia sp.]|uniref:cupin domain-containing protein n=1 Tax=uncultured Jannaschia sp. TaxID=293347 RepID=UPI00262AB9BA|nr:cupin domain-containing protein [uncultured Jannaschia sp.]
MTQGNAMANVAPMAEITIRELRFADDGTVPNNPDLSVVLMRGALGNGAAPRAVTALLEANGWGGSWVWQVFPYHHYHPNAHEVLAVATGEARLMLGGPAGEEVPVAAGDVIVIPPGIGHCQITASGDFQICGAYPPGQEEYDTVRAEAPHDGAVRDRIAAVPRPGTDPIYGRDGPLPKAWGAIPEG